MLKLNVNEKNFKKEVLLNDKTVLLDFFAPWCGPCRMLGPVLEQIAEERPDIDVVKIDIDENVRLMAEYEVMTVPSLFVIKNGETTNKAIGVMSKQKILELL